MTRLRTRLTACAIALTSAAGTLLVGSSPAQAAPSFSFHYSPSPNGYNIWINNNDRGLPAGSGRWLQDPDGPYPGDALVADDQLADGYGVEAHLSTGRIATTRGHSAPYTHYKTGNLPEGNKYYMYVCVVKGDYSNCSNSVAVYA
ncbi:hypothetical protein ACWDV4_22070 [Micromonospora sp. NPDC003197]